MSEAYERAVNYGVQHLNGAFVGAGRPRRIFKGSSTRITGTDIFWMIVLTIPSLGILALLVWVASFIPGLNAFITPWVLFIAPVFGALAGILLSSKFTPYAKYSGEGLMDFFAVNRQSLAKAFIWKLNGQKTMIGEASSRVDGKRKIEKVEYWMGTARSQLVPMQSPYTNNEIVVVDLEPRTIQTSWRSDLAKKNLAQQQTKKKVIG